MITLSYVSVVVCILAIITAIIVWFYVRLHREYKHVLSVLTAVLDDAIHRQDYLTTCNAREMKLLDLFSGVLIDLAHSKDHNVIQWKLMIIRSLEDIITSHGYIENDSIIDVIFQRLSSMPPEERSEFIKYLKESCAGYYVMDVVTGQNFCELFDVIADLHENASIKLEKGREIYDKLSDMVRTSEYKFTVVDTAPPVTKTDTDEWKEIMDLFNCTPDPEATGEMHQIQNEGDDSNEEPEQEDTDRVPEKAAEEAASCSDDVSRDTVSAGEAKEVKAKDSSEKMADPQLADDGRMRVIYQ